MTFREFLNQRDTRPTAYKLGRLAVTNDYAAGAKPPDFFRKPKVEPVKHQRPHLSLLTPSRRPLSQRTMARKPTDFLARRTRPGI